jgi:tetratricopeptide (TPR) repeat protein
MMDHMVTSYSGKFLAPKLEELYVRRAEIFFVEKDYLKAIADCTESIKINQKFDQAYLLKAKSLIKSGRKIEAAKDYEAILQNNPKDELAAQNLASLLIENEQLEKAIKILGRAIALERETPQNYELRALAYQKLGKLELAKRDRQQAANLRKRAN